MACNPKWTFEEEQFARHLRSKGKSYREISQRLGRTEAAICQRLNSIRGSGKFSLRRNRMNYKSGALYEILEIQNNNSGISFLPARYYFVQIKKGINKRPDLYLFQSCCGSYYLSFSFPQIVNSFVIRRISKEKGGSIRCSRSGREEYWKRSFIVLDVGKKKEETCPSLTQ